MTKKVLSLFSGCGGLDLGFEGGFTVPPRCVNETINSSWIEKKYNSAILLRKTGFETVFANDILDYAQASWVPHFSSRGTDPSVFHKESIIDLVKKHHSGQIVFPENIDIVTGGFPCQDFSVAGKRNGFNSHKSHLNRIDCEISDPTTENRGMLYMWLKQVVEITKPKLFVAENVKGLISLGKVRQIIESDFRSIDDDGYFVFPSRVLNAAEYGVPQARERIFFIGINKKHLKSSVFELLKNGDIPNNLNPYPPKTHYLPSSQPDDTLIRFVSCSEALSGLDEPEVSNDLSQKKYSKAKFLQKGQGNKEISIDGLSPTIRAEHHGNIEYRRLSIENGGVNLAELDKGYNQRRLTVRECARLQTFPDNYEFVRDDEYKLSASGAYKVIGNAVPPLLGYHVAQKINSIWDNLFIKN